MPQSGELPECIIYIKPPALERSVIVGFLAYALQHSLPCFTARSAAVAFCLPLPSKSAILLRHTGSVNRWDGALGGRGCRGATKDHLGTTCGYGMQNPQPTTLEHLSASSLFTYGKGYVPSRCQLCQVLFFLLKKTQKYPAVTCGDVFLVSSYI